MRMNSIKIALARRRITHHSAAMDEHWDFDVAVMYSTIHDTTSRAPALNLAKTGTVRVAAQKLAPWPDETLASLTYTRHKWFNAKPSSSRARRELFPHRAGFLYGGRTWYLFTWSFLDLQCDTRCLSSTFPVFDSRTPYSSSLLTSLGMGLCHWPSHQAGGRSGVRAHWCGWRWQLSGPAYLFQMWPQPTCVESPSTNRLLWTLLKNVKLVPEGS